MRIHVATTSAGYELARGLQTSLEGDGHEVLWHGAETHDPGDDYPVFAVRVGRAVIADEDAGVPTRGIIVGGSGAGETIAVNKVAGIRAVPALGPEFVRLARRHADADVLVIGADLVDAATAADLVATLIAEPFGDALEDARRIVHTNEFESSGTIEGWMVEG